MEGMISTLLKDFEEGRVNRRELIRTLAAVALAGPAAAMASTDTTLQAAADKSPWKTTHLDHISYAVSDYKKSAEFYASLMGWEPQTDTGTQVTMKIGDIGGDHHPQQPSSGRRRRARRRGWPAGRGPAGRRPGQPSAGHRRHQPRLVGHHAVGHRRGEGGARQARPQPAARHGGQRFRGASTCCDPDGWDLQISNVNKPK